MTRVTMKSFFIIRESRLNDNSLKINKYFITNLSVIAVSVNPRGRDWLTLRKVEFKILNKLSLGAHSQERINLVSVMSNEILIEMQAKL